MLRKIAVSAAWLAALFIVVSFTAILANGQTAAAICNYPYKLQGTQQTKTQDNTKSGCTSWSFTHAGTAPVTVQTSQDGITWGSTGLTVTNESLPTVPASYPFGVVKFTGYAPYLRIVASGTPTQSVTGLLFGSLALVATGGGDLPPYLPRNASTSYTALVPSEWTSTQIVGTRTDLSNRINMRTLGGNVLANAQYFQSICRAYPTPPFTAKLTIWAPDGLYYTNDASQHMGISLEENSTDRRIMSYVRNRLYHGVVKGISRQYTSAVSISNDAIVIAYAGLPLTFYLSDNGTTRTFGFWDFSFSQLIQWGNTAITNTNTDYITTPDRLCFTFANGNGNYPGYISLLGYDVSSP